MQIFIDESGNLGKDGRFFVIAGFIPRNPKRIKNAVRRSCVKFGREKPLPELKGYHLTFPEKQDIFNQFTSVNDFDIIYIVADKTHLHPHILSDQNICFNYLAGYMLKALIASKEEDVHITCDNRNIAVASGRSFSDYLKIQAYSAWQFSHKIHLGYADSRACYHLQVADLVANAIYAYYDRGKRHFYTQLEPYMRQKVRFPYKLFNQ